MGGGAAMRAAAKFVGIGAAASAGGMRGVPLAPAAEHSVLNASRPVSAALSSPPPLGAKAGDVAPLHTAASWEFDDWEVASDDGGKLIVGGDGEAAPPRVVFGGVPSFQEAKAATSELKDAVDKIYLSSNSSESEGSSSPGSQVSVPSPFHSELETNSRVIEAFSIPSVPIHAFQAFQLLSASTEAQTVVASVACDPDVWNAVMQNPAVKDFFQSHNLFAGFEVEETPEDVEELSDSDSETGFVDSMSIMLNKASLTVAEMVSNMSTYLQSIFGFSTAGKSSAEADADAGGITKANFMNHVAMGGTFMGLAVLVVMVVLLKRA